MGGARQKLEVADRFSGFGFMPFLEGGGAVEEVVVEVVAMVVKMDEVVVEADEVDDDVALGDRERFRD